MQSAALHRSPKQARLIEDTCVTHGIEFYRRMLQERCRPGDELAQFVTRVAQAALRASDLWFMFRTQAVESITDEVADFLTERELCFGRAEKLVSRSGRGWISVRRYRRCLGGRGFPAGRAVVDGVALVATQRVRYRSERSGMRAKRQVQQLGRRDIDIVDLS